jgi:hypothetical protein
MSRGCASALSRATGTSIAPTRGDPAIAVVMRDCAVNRDLALLRLGGF